CNEAQERYVLAIAPSNLEVFKAICERERCPFAVLGTATDDGRLLVEDPELHDRPIDVELAMVLGKPPRMLRDVRREKRKTTKLSLDGVTVQGAVHRVLRHPA